MFHSSQRTHKLHFQIYILIYMKNLQPFFFFFHCSQHRQWIIKPPKALKRNWALKKKTVERERMVHSLTVLLLFIALNERPVQNELLFQLFLLHLQLHSSQLRQRCPVVKCRLCFCHLCSPPALLLKDKTWFHRMKCTILIYTQFNKTRRTVGQWHFSHHTVIHFI